MEMPFEQKWKLTVNSMGMFIQNILVPVFKEFGDEALQVLKEDFQEWGKEFGPVLQKVLQVDVSNVKDMAKVVDYMDEIMGVRGEWVETSPNRMVKQESFCPMVRYIKDCPQFCDLLIYDWGEAMLAAMNPKAKLSMTKCMAKGDDVCNIILETEE
ncbi:MAG: L-2-amino-thiazoline-4-carboxylic acid hydrolase [Candidatus Lokiarchaeia archaeon]